MRSFLSLVACALLLCAATAYAQEITGTIAGTVKDTAGASVAGATVTITNLDKKIVARTVTTSDEGTYSAPDLPVGNYEVAVEAPNFKKYVATKVKLDVAQHRTIDATLEAGQVAEVVTVEAEPLQVDLQTPTAANLISGTQVRELSLNNRNFVQLTALMPGVSSNLADQVYVGTTNPNGEANTVSISVNGARSAANNWTVDGADNTDRGSNLTIMMYPSVDAIGEFKVSRSLYPADTGRAGGGQVNVVTKSGTNQFHGSAYEFVRNERLNANRFFINANPNATRDTNGRAKRPPLRYNNFGWTLGGPLPTPHFGEGGPSVVRGKTFFFFSEEWRRTITYTEFRPTVPTAALKQGVFPVFVCVQFTGTTCTQAANQITNINPVAAAYIRDIYGTIPDPAPGTFTLTSPQRNLFNFRQEILKIDHTFSKKLSAFYRFENDKIPTEEPNALFSSGSQLPGVSTTKTDSPGKSHTARFTLAATPTTILDGGYAYTRGAIFSDPVGILLQSVSSDINPAMPFANTLGRVPVVSPGFASTSTFGPYRNFSTYHQWNMNLSKIMGNHTLKFGGQLHFFRKFENAGGGNQGTFSFSGTTRPTATTPGVPAGAAVVTSSNAFLQQWANFLLGNVSSFTQTRFDITADIRARNHEFYGQDEWKVRPNLTLYYGARYSLFRQPTDANGLLTNFDPAAYNPARAFGVDPLTGNRVGAGDPLNGIIVQGQNSPFGNKVGSEDNSNIGPRVGLAWDPFKDGKTAIRTGYGIYYDVPLYGTYE
ncbi:MAG: carboxypeptidase regulatory-like domain-containing protein, partial [Acidobacteria bacterium]|nr:carboxypeptidase regulatory-like domain-containing protein [Acidobacteriota bacterium]